MPQTSARTITTSAAIGYTNPTTGITLTRQELYEYAQGRKRDPSGRDVMYFKPSFVEEDPWRGMGEMIGVAGAGGGGGAAAAATGGRNA
jgi:hypothetical protein